MFGILVIQIKLVCPVPLFFLKDFSGNVIGQTTTNEEGYYIFLGLPWSRYSIEVIYPDCSSTHPSLGPTSVPSKSPTPLRFPSSLPTFVPSFDSSASPSLSPTEGMVIRRRVLDPYYDEQIVLVGATVYLYDFSGNVIAETTTGSDGYYEFLSLSWSTRFYVKIIYPDCASEGPSLAPSNVPSIIISSLHFCKYCPLFLFFSFLIFFFYTNELTLHYAYFILQRSSKPSLTPSESNSPTGYWDRPHLQGSRPSSAPSFTPSQSVHPSATPMLLPSGVPSSLPTILTLPSILPTVPPSKSGWPSHTDSEVPSISVMPTSMPISAPSINPSHRPITTAPTIVPSTVPSKSSEPSPQPSAQPSQSKEPTHMPSSVPTLATELPSIQPTRIINENLSVIPSGLPSLANQLSDSPSGLPTSSKLPTYYPSSIHNPTSPPTEGYVVQGREFNPCDEGRVVLAGAKDTLFSVLGQEIGQTITASEGRWEFTSLPIGRYFWVTDYPECRRLQEKDRHRLTQKESIFLYPFWMNKI